MAEAPDTRAPATRVARNTVLRAVAEIVGKIASLVLFAYIARELGEATLGEFVFALAIAQLLWGLAGFGLDRLMLRDVARDRGAVNSLYPEVNSLKALAGVAGLGVAVGAVALFEDSGRVVALTLILSASMVVTLIAATAQTVFQAHERMEYYFYAAVPNKILAALFGIGVLASGGGIVGVAVGNLVAALIGLVLAVAIMRRRFARPPTSLRVAGLRALARRAAPFGLQEMLGQVIFRFDTILLAALTTSAVVGEYGAGYRILEASLFLAWSVGTSVLPMFSYLGPDSDPPLQRVYDGSLKFVLVIVTPVAMALFVCSRAVVDAIYGLPEFSGTVPVLRWLAFAIVVYSVGHLAGILVLVRRPGRVTVIATAVVAAFNIALNAVLIPIYEAEGAAAATLATEAVLAVIVLALARPVAGWPRWSRAGGGAALAGVAMGAAMWGVRDDLALALPLGAVAYVAVLALFEARSLSGDLAAVRAVLRRGGTPAEPERALAP